MSKGLASVKTLSAKEIAKKFNLPLATVAKKIAAGVKVEKEHTTSLRQANEIARDHLGERPDYYEKIHKMEKTKIVKEDNATGAVRGLGYVTGDPGVNYVDQYINTNALAYDPMNGAKLEFMRKFHNKLHKGLGFDEYNPTSKKLSEAKLNELGEYDNKGGSPGYEATSAPIRAVRKRDVEEQSPANISYKERPMYEKSTGNNPMPAGAERGIYEDDTVKDLDNKFFNKDLTTADIHRRMEVADGTSYKDVATRLRTGSTRGVANLNRDDRIDEISAELVGKVSNARFFRGEAPSRTLNRAIIKKFIESSKKKEQSKTIKEETKMDNKELINEALDCILEDNLPEMKENLMLALQEKAMEKLEERKKEIAANYFAQ